MFGPKDEVQLLFVSEGRGDAWAGGGGDAEGVCGEGGVEGWDEYFGSWVSVCCCAIVLCDP